VASLFLFPALALGAARTLALEDAVQRALRQNPALGAVAAGVAQAQGAVLEAHGLDDLVIDGALTLSRERHTLLPNVPLQQPSTQDFAWSLGVTQPLPTGGEVGLHLRSDLSLTTFATGTGSGLSLSSQRSATPSLQLSLTHPLLRGFGPSVARAPRHRAEVQQEVAEANRAAAASELIRAVVSAYWELALASRQAAVQHDAAQAARDQLARVKANMSVGKLPPTASAEIEVAIAAREDDALQAEQLRAERAVELARLLGISPTEADQLVPASAEPALPPLPALAPALQQAGAHAPQLLAERGRISSAEIDVDVSRNGLLPQLDLALSGGPTTSAPDVGSALDGFTGLHDYVLQAGITFREAVPHRAARGKRDQALAGLHKARLTEADLLGQIESTVVRLESAGRLAKRRVDALAHAEAAARLDLEAERARFEVGRATNFDVLRRQEEVADAQLRMAQARVDYLEARVGIDALTGALLSRYGVTFR
jgi:outer membrane protein TolC